MEPYTIVTGTVVIHGRIQSILSWMALCCETHGRARGTTTINDYTATKRKSPDIIRGFKLRDWHKFTWNKFGQPQVVRWEKYTNAFHQ